MEDEMKLSKYVQHVAHGCKVADGKYSLGLNEIGELYSRALILEGNQITMNLACPDRSDIPFTKIKYQDGQVDINIPAPEVNDLVGVRIVSRMNSYEDLMYILSTQSALKKLPYSNDLYVPCFYGQRSDRPFFENSAHALKLITDIINLQKFRSVTILHPHSDVLPSLLDRCIVKNSDEFVDWAMSLIGTGKDVVFISPDAGSYKYNQKFSVKYNLDLVPAMKVRYNGEPRTEIHTKLRSMEGSTCVMIDDYIDGGRTFAGIAKGLNHLGAKKIVLVATHGLFSYGFDIDRVDEIYTTNSISEINNKNIFQMDVMR